jgi:hypothetical protein
MRGVILAVLMILAGSAASPAPAPAEAPAEKTIARCKTTPDFCKALIREASSRASAAKEACIPANTKQDELAVRVMHTVEDIIEEDDGFKDFNYGILAGQIIAFLFPCGVVS